MVKKKNSSFEKTIKYTGSTIDYLGLVSWSLINRCGNAAKKSGSSILEAATGPFSIVKSTSHPDKPRQIKYLPQDREKIAAIESTLARLEKRLSSLEKQGIRGSENISDKPAEKKEIDNEKRAVLRMLVDDQKRLKKMIKS